MSIQRYMNEAGSMVPRDNGSWCDARAAEAEVGRLTGERDAALLKIKNLKAALLTQAQRVPGYIGQIGDANAEKVIAEQERDAAVAAREAAVEALREIDRHIALNPLLSQAHAEDVLRAIRDRISAILAGHAPAPSESVCAKNAHTDSEPYGRCPHCGSPGIARERRLNGDDRCTRGHTYPSRMAITAPASDPTAGCCAPSDLTDAATGGERERRLEEALAFYANNGTLVLMQDGGRRARAALAGTTTAPSPADIYDKSDRESIKKAFAVARAALAGTTEEKNDG